MKKLANQWSPSNFREDLRQRLYLKDIDCPIEWHEALQKVIHPNVFYLNENITSTGEKKREDDDLYGDTATTAPAGDLMSSLPTGMRAENLMCYIGHEGTYTPAHREMCASLGQNIMVEASGNTDGEKPGSSIWFMTESKDREVVREYFLSMLGHDIEIEKHFAQINAWKKATFDVYVVEQKPGDFILIPPLAAHQVWNRGTRTIKVAWNRTTAETLEMAMHEALPKARLVCRDEQYKNKAMIYYTLKKYYSELSLLEENEQRAQMDLISLGQEIIRSSPRVKLLASDFKKLFSLFTEILVDETFGHKETGIEYLEFDSCITCAYCRSNIFNRFLTCRKCVRPLINGDDDQYDVCMECYAMGRSCACISGLQWCEQWAWSDLVDSYDTWRAMVMKNDGYIDFEQSPQPLEVARQRSGKKSLAQICQEALKRRPFTDIMQPRQAMSPSESEGEGSNKKKKKRKKKKGEVRRCHVCCHPEYSYRVHECTNPGCSEAYCYGVLYRAFDMMPQKVLEDEQWQCPKCLGICNCGGCRRTGQTTPYAPKNTSLGHDTKAVADDRSTEALVDFRIHNLAWLKAAGEESRSKDSKRMKRLQHLAETAKTTDSAEQTQASQDMQDEEDVNDPTNENQNGSDTADPSIQKSSNWAYGEHQRQTSGDEPNSAADDFSAYPDPSIIAQNLVGQLYYRQDDVSSQDKILFDPFQEPTAETLRMAEEPEVPEFIKKSIRAAKKKAKRENEDPEYRSRYRPKKHRTDQDIDMLDNMDPALFGSETVSTAEPSAIQPTDDITTEAHPLPPRADGVNGETSGDVDMADAEAPAKVRQFGYEANEPILRHAKPMMSYAEADEHEEAEEEIVEAIPEPPPVPQYSGRGTPPPGQEHMAADLAAEAVRTMLRSKSGNNSTMPASQPRSTGHGEETGNGSTSPAVVRRRGRPPRNHPQEPPTEITKNDKESMDESDDNTSDIGILTSDIQIPRINRGRPRKAPKPANTEEMSGNDTADEGHKIGFDAEVQQLLEQGDEGERTRRSRRSDANTFVTVDVSDDYSSDSEARRIKTPKTRGARGRGRGRPPGRGAGQQRQARDENQQHQKATATARSPSPEANQLMSMAERLAARGRTFKIGSRRSRGRPPGTLTQSRSNRRASPDRISDGRSSPLEVTSPGPHSGVDDSHIREPTVPTVVSLADVDNEDEYMSVSVSISDDDSDRDADIPARAIDASRRGRGGMRGRGGRGRPRGRGGR